MKVSYSIKFVLPALVPELSYDELEIKEVVTASNTFLSMVNGSFKGETAKVKSQLLEYCKLDAYAMVKILERLKKVWVRYGVFGLYIDITVNYKKENELKEEINLLNSETNWIDLISSFDLYLEYLENFEENYADENGNINKVAFLRVSIDNLITETIEIRERQGIWKYCNEENYSLVVSESNKKLFYLIQSLKDIGCFFKGPDSLLELEGNTYEIIDMKNSETSSANLSEKQKNTAKLNLAILYKLGIYDHLKELKSIKENDSIFSRVLNSFLGGGKSTYQPYLSAAKSNPKSNSSQNNPFSDKLLEKAEEILIEAGGSYKDLVKNPPN